MEVGHQEETGVEGCWNRGQAHVLPRIEPRGQPGHCQGVRKMPPNDRSPCCHQRGKAPAHGVKQGLELKPWALPTNLECLH